MVQDDPSNTTFDNSALPSMLVVIGGKRSKVKFHFFSNVNEAQR
jgi:hypothetical protein